jgi:hypothetical protein
MRRAPFEDKGIAYGMGRLHGFLSAVNKNFTGYGNAVGLEEILGFIFGQGLAALLQSGMNDLRRFIHLSLHAESHLE